MTNITNKPIIGTVDEFHSEKCFELYLHAVNLATQINEYLDLGYLVFNNSESHKNKFVFHNGMHPSHSNY